MQSEQSEINECKIFKYHRESSNKEILLRFIDNKEFKYQNC